MLKKILIQDWKADFAYAPPTRESVINTDDVQNAMPCESRGCGPWMKITFRNGNHVIAHGRPEDLI